MHRRRPALHGPKLFVLVALCAVLAGSCAEQGSPAGGGQPTGASQPPSSSQATRRPRTTTVTPRDAGRTVTLRVGDRLDLALGKARQTGDEWRLLTYPVSLLSLSPAPAGHYRFTATTPGRGRLTANPTPLCAPTDNPDPMLCPPRDAGAKGSRPRAPRARFTLTVDVSR